MKISVVTICKNEAHRIENTILSVIGQAYNNKELIVIDGGSTDGTTEILERYKDNITHLITEEDNGIYHAMNKGIELSTGEYLQFMNGGDFYYDRNVLSSLVHNGKSSDLIYGDVMYEKKSGELEYFKHPKQITTLFLALSTINHQSILIRKELFKLYGFFNETYSICSDYEFLLKTVVCGDVIVKYVPIVVACYNKDGISFIVEHKEEKWNEKKDIQNKYLPFYLRGISKLRHYIVEYKYYIFPEFTHKYLNRIYERFMFK